MAGQYSESSKLSFPWSLFGGSFRHLFVAILDRMRPNDRVLVFAMVSTRFGVLKTILKRSSNARVLVFAMDCASFDMLKTILKRSSNDPQMPTHWSSQWILHVLTFSERSSNDPQTLAYWFLQYILQVLTCSKRCSHGLQMILERSSNAGVLVFAKDSARFEVLRTILKRSSTDPQTLAYWFLQYILQVLTCSKRFSNDPQTNLKRSSNARVLVFAMDSTSFEVLRMILKQTSNDPQTPA